MAREDAVEARHMLPEEAATPESRKRPRAPSGTYSEQATRKTRKTNLTGGYVEDTRRKEGTREVLAIEMSPYALAAIVAGEYEWRDGALPPIKTAGRKRRIW